MIVGQWDFRKGRTFCTRIFHLKCKTSMVEVELKAGKCFICDDEIPKEIMFMYKLGGL